MCVCAIVLWVWEAGKCITSLICNNPMLVMTCHAVYLLCECRSLSLTAAHGCRDACEALLANSWDLLDGLRVAVGEVTLQQAPGCGYFLLQLNALLSPVRFEISNKQHVIFLVEKLPGLVIAGLILNVYTSAVGAMLTLGERLDSSCAYMQSRLSDLERRATVPELLYTGISQLRSVLCALQAVSAEWKGKVLTLANSIDSIKHLANIPERTVCKLPGRLCTYCGFQQRYLEWQD